MLHAARASRGLRLLAAALEAGAATVFLVGTTTLFSVSLVDSDVLEYREFRDGAAPEIMRSFVRMSESAAAAPMTWYLPRVFALVAVIGLLLLAAHRIEPHEPHRLPFH
jgi:hypothetical protein